MLLLKKLDLLGLLMLLLWGLLLLLLNLLLLLLLLLSLLLLSLLLLLLSSKQMRVEIRLLEDTRRLSIHGREHRIVIVEVNSRWFHHNRFVMIRVAISCC